TLPAGYVVMATKESDKSETDKSDQWGSPLRAYWLARSPKKHQLPVIALIPYPSTPVGESTPCPSPICNPVTLYTWSVTLFFFTSCHFYFSTVGLIFFLIGTCCIKEYSNIRSFCLSNIRMGFCPIRSSPSHHSQENGEVKHQNRPVK